MAYLHLCYQYAELRIYTQFAYLEYEAEIQSSAAWIEFLGRIAECVDNLLYMMFTAYNHGSGELPDYEQQPLELDCMKAAQRWHNKFGFKHEA